MRIFFGITSLIAAGLLAFGLTPIVRQIVIPYLLNGPGVPFSVIQFGSIKLYEGHICLVAALVVVLIVVLVAIAVNEFTPQKKTTRPPVSDK